MSNTTKNNPARSPLHDGDTTRWLESLGFSQYAALFAENGIRWVDLNNLTHEDLKELGVDLFVHRKLILSEIKKLAGKLPEPVKKQPGAGTPVGSAVIQQPQIPAPAPARVASVPASVPIAKRPPPSQAVAVAPPRKAGYWARFGGNFLFVSIAAHLLFAVLATLYVVQIFSSKKLTFVASPPSPNPSQRSLEHKVQMAKKQNTMSAPAPMKKITSTGPAKVTLPEMPAMPSVNPATPTTMSGMSMPGAGFAPSAGLMGASGGGFGGGGVTLFGLRNKTDNALEGTFYSLKEKADGTPTNCTEAQFFDVIKRFIKSWNVDVLEKYHKSDTKLYATQIYTPDILSGEGPKSFGQPPMTGEPLWVVLYRGRVTPPESGIYHFVGGADAVMIVKFNGKTVLNASYIAPWAPEMANVPPNPMARYVYGGHILGGGGNDGTPPGGFVKGLAFEARALEPYDIEVLVGDQGGETWFNLLIEKEGDVYRKDTRGNPVCRYSGSLRIRSPL